MQLGDNVRCESSLYVSQIRLTAVVWRLCPDRLLLIIPSMETLIRLIQILSMLLLLKADSLLILEISRSDIILTRSGARHNSSTLVLDHSSIGILS